MQLVVMQKNQKNIENTQEPALLLKEMILENFMAYKYARIQLNPGLNLILGPNGAGKSSLLLALSVALGQAHTERSRKLSDLIRWGEEIARVTLVFDNRPVNGKRPNQRIRSDELIITRYIRKDGEYWHQINFKPVTKMEVQEILNSFGIDPDNILIIMQQYMIEQIARMSPQEKLQSIERALGLISFREKINDAKNKLQSTAGEEKVVTTLLSEAERTLNKWKEEVDKLTRRDSLKLRLEELEIELLWCKREETNQIIEESEKKHENIEKKLKEIEVLLRKHSTQLKEKSKKINNTIEELVRESDSEKRKVYATQIRHDLRDYIKLRVRKAIARKVQKVMNKEKSKLEEKIAKLKEELEKVEEEAKKKGPKPKEIRNEDEIKEEMEKIRIELNSLGTVVENAEEIYNSYKKTYEDIREKATKIKIEKEKVEEEIKELTNRWRKKMEETVEEIDKNFKERMARINAIGEVRLINIEDLEQAGIQILVSFGGAPLTELNYYTQSGGERSASVVAFILSLQSLIKSPIRALDEFDVHMDPKTRETFFGLIEEEAKKHPNTLFLVVTPGQVPKGIKDATGIIVQKVGREAVVTIA
ncbi:MAG: AAA family ATPase [Thaumarchaeota archaeon]|jgi:chromosome segregation ATPase|nr:AAA family ATPase [Nitrososphaerota archaeon]